MKNAPTPRERGYVEAALALLDGHDSTPIAVRVKRHADRLGALAAAHADDPNAAAFYGLALVALARAEGRSYDAHAVDVLQRAMARAPDHPAALHYLLHAFDTVEYASRALPIAERYAAVAPRLPHALHIPSHVFAQLGLWEKVAAANEAAWKAVQGSGYSVQGASHVQGAEHVQGAHALEWWHYAELQRGRFARARELLAHATPTPRAMVARDALERGDWDAAVALAGADGSADPDGVAAYARGLAAARAAWLHETPKLLETARAAAATLDRTARRAGPHSLAELHRVSVLAAIAAAQEERAELQLLLTHAAGLVVRPSPAHSPAHPLIPVHELAGDLWLQVSRVRDAAGEYAASLARHPRRARSLIGLARASAGAGDRARARAAYEELLVIWKDADPDRPELKEARDYLKR